MKILITGAGGFLGFEIAKLLIAEGHVVFNFSRNHHSKLDYLSIKTIPGDLRIKSDVEKALQGIDVVFHVAALAGVWGKKDDFFSINFEGTKNLVDACKKLNIRKLIYTSTPSVVFGNKDLEGVDESTSFPDKYLTHYAHSKSLAEKYVLDNTNQAFQACALRPHLIWGPGDPHIIPRLIEKAKKNRLKIVGDGNNLVDVIHVKNAAHAHLLAFRKLELDSSISGKAFFIGQERPVSLWTFINQILVQKNLRPVTTKISFKFAYFLGCFFEVLFTILKIYKKDPPMTRFVSMQLAHSHYFSQEKARLDLGYYPILSVEAGLKTLDNDT
jgi:nucleoside-diphosphate-sugar epimerase